MLQKLACAEPWLPDVAFLPEAAGLAVDQLYRALDFLAVWSDRIEHEVFLQAADLFRLDVDLIFYDTTTAYFETDEADEQPADAACRGDPLLAAVGAIAHELAALKAVRGIGVLFSAARSPTALAGS